MSLDEGIAAGRKRSSSPWYQMHPLTIHSRCRAWTVLSMSPQVGLDDGPWREVAGHGGASLPGLLVRKTFARPSSTTLSSERDRRL